MHCSLLAVRRRLRGPAAGGWSLVLPARWVMPVWQALTFAGARAVGLREWHWAAVDEVRQDCRLNTTRPELCLYHAAARLQPHLRRSDNSVP